MGGWLITGSVSALIVLLLGIAVPLAGGTDFNSVPRVAGTLLLVAVWLVAMASAARARHWGWLAALSLLSPLWFLLYTTQTPERFTYPERWSAFDSQPWHLVGLLLAPLPLLAYGVLRVWRDSRE